MPEGRKRSLIHAPYNFVPLSAYVHEVEWADRISWDVPMSDGVSGHLVVELEVVTPLCVGERGPDGFVQPFRTPEDELAVPGTSIKGMLRNVVEIATFSKFQLVDRDRRYAVRDLSKPELYRNRMRSARPGWLFETADGWRIQPCKVARVAQQSLVEHLRSRHGNAAAEKLKRCFTSRQPVGMRQKYEAWLDAGADLNLPFEAVTARNQPPKADLSRTGKTGRLVMTGQASANLSLATGGFKKGKFKRRELIFYAGEGEAKVVPRSVQRDFELNHSLQQGQRRSGRDQPNEEWGYWRERMKRERVPVFFMEEDGVTSIGLTQMYRLAYKQSVGETIDNTSTDHRPGSGAAEPMARPKVDFAEALFGYVRGHGGGEALRGRLDVGLFVLTSGGELTARVTAVLNGPKPTYYPSYVDQSPHLDTTGDRLRPGAEYLTYMDKKAELRGWKRYPARPRPARLPSSRPDASGEKGENVETTWTAVREGVFLGKLRFHNVRPVELGAVLWALDFGGCPRRCHTLGYAKPFGYGNVRLHVRSNHLRRLAGGEVDLDGAREEFLRYMEKAVPDWLESEQIVQLLAMADPEVATDLSYMVLDPDRRTNDFLDAKGRGRHDPKYVLPAYVTFHGKTDRQRFPRDPT